MIMHNPAQRKKLWMKCVLALLFLLSNHSFGQDIAVSIDPRPDDCPAPLKLLLGEYGTGTSPYLILEHDGSLFLSGEQRAPVKLRRTSQRTFIAAPEGSLPRGEIVFEGPINERPTSVLIGRSRFTRRAFDGEDGSTFTIEPLHSYETLRRRAEQAKPPEEQGSFVPSSLVDIRSLDSSVFYDIRYATTNNFMQQQFYSQAKAFLQLPAANAFIRAHQWLETFGYGLLIHDAYRPWTVTKMFWDATPRELKNFVANPATGSRHNRGCAVDVTLYDRTTGEPVDMVSGYDEFSPRSYPDYAGGTSIQRWHRTLLRTALEREGFDVYHSEWWHFDYQDWKKYKIQNMTFEDLARRTR
jgi:D-alanyl-D-alanine dipeptidase